MENLFSSMAKDIHASELREILKITQQPEIISFAAGLAAPDLFPVEQIAKMSQIVLETDGAGALQYNNIEGYQPLREKIAKRMSDFDMPIGFEQILITTGSQQGLDFSGRIFLDEGDVVVCESPSYLGAMSAFKAYKCRFKEIKTDDDGMDLSDLEVQLKTTDNIKIIYLIPDFQNPSGRSWSTERRKKVYALAQKYNKVIVEDNPYGELRFEGVRKPTIKSFDTDGRVVYLGTFSKTFCPGLRIGWVAASPVIINKYILVKQCADLHSNSMSQRVLNLFLEHYDYDTFIGTLCTLYKERRDLMIKTMDTHFPEGAKYITPKGGLFIWVELPEHINTKVLLEDAIKEHVAYVPGDSFFPNGGVYNTLRLNFSNMNNERIVEGIKRLGIILNKAL